ncbi:YjgP/YjgQ family permease [bacterium]|nr:YjgP/YjgQ family permease [bacterium]
MRLFLYILRDFFKYLIGALCLTLFLFILFDFIHKTTRYFPRYKPSAGLVFKMYLYQLPGHILQAMPIAALLASVTCMVLLGRTNELTAMRSAGMGPFRIGAPLFAGGVILALTSWVLSEYVIPVSSGRMHYVEEVQIEGTPSFEIAQGVSWLRLGDMIYNFGTYDLELQAFQDLRISRIAHDFTPVQSVEAKSAKSLSKDSGWALAGVSVMDFDEQGNVTRITRKDEMVIKMPVDVHKLQRERRLPSEMSRRELFVRIKGEENSGRDILPLEVDYHLKLAFPFAAIVVSLLGLKFMYSSERSAETARSILLALGVGMSFWFLQNSFLALGRRGNLSPALSAWAANIILLAIVMWDVWRARVTSR